MRRTNNDICDSINSVRKELGLDVRSYPNFPRLTLLLIETRFKALYEDWKSNLDGDDDIMTMHFTFIATIYDISEYDARVFYDHIHKTT